VNLLILLRKRPGCAGGKGGRSLDWWPLSLCYLGFIAVHCSPYAGPSDASGYLNTARLIAEGNLVVSMPRIDGLPPENWDYFQQQPLGFRVDSKTGTMVPTYPIGYSLHLWLAGVVVGLDWATVPTNLVLVIAAAVLMLAIGRRFGLPWAWAIAGVAVLWACPLFLSYSLQPMSDMPATVWVLASIWCALRARENWRWGVLVGVCVTMSVWVRPSNLVVLLPIAVVLSLRWRAWLAMLAAGFPGGVFQAWYNHTLYGSVTETGYGAVGHLFRATHVAHNSWHFVWWTCLLLCPLVPLAALGLPWVRKEQPLLWRLVLVWTAVFTCFYLPYFHAGETWWYLRFILPVFPAVILAAMVVLRRVVDRIGRPSVRLGVGACLLVVVLGWEIEMVRHFRLDLTRRGELTYVNTAEWMKSHAPDNAIVMQMQVSGAFTYYTDFTIVRWDLVSENNWARLQEAAKAAGRPIYATLFGFEEDRALRKAIPGNWKFLTKIDQVTIWRLEEDASPASGS